ncbi:MAG: 16S rRNA (guanine(527)-N(7))-methyltransferase RsmG [Clostridiales bacterium]|nr:16S rRNA (guanine(527)-N(7))-methyltransferase RsmG [Clostridiales bacterium]
MDINYYLQLIEGEYKEKFEEYKNLLVEYNKKYNLTAILDDKGVKIKHFLDSVLGEKFFKKGASVIEIGSGGGFPSTPLKIIRPDLRFTLVESTGKKCEFLQVVVDKLVHKDVNILNIRAEDGGKDKSLREKFDACTARAVARLNVLCEYCLPFVKVGGYFIAYKGDAEEEIIEAQNAVKILGGKIEKVERVELPDEAGVRNIIAIKKIAPTPIQYPRGNGKERKSPIK